MQQTEPTPTASPVEKPTVPDQTAVSPQITVEAPGVLVEENDYAKIDYSNQDKGYVMVCYTQDTAAKLKAQVKGPSGVAYTYHLTPKKWAAFPLSDENGSYKITLYRNVSESKYAAVLSKTVDVAMSDPFGPFLRSNQYVDFDAAPKTVAKAAQLTVGITDPLKKVAAIYDFVIHTMIYDRDLAAAVESGYLPVLDSVLEKKSGICFDYAAIMTGMLRSQGVPAKLVVGYSGDVYHAWIHVWTEQSGWINGAIYFDGVSWKRMDPTFASGGNEDILNYIGDGKNYVAKYFY